jgi:hypothetical protein
MGNSGPYRDPRLYQQGPPREREAGLYMLAVDFDSEPEHAGKAYCRIARVKMDQTIEHGPMEQIEKEEVIVEKELLAEGGVTRS